MPALRPLGVFSCILLASTPRAGVGQADLPETLRASDQVCPLIRSDDAGMSHSVNAGLERLVKMGLPLSVSVMFACPWYQETFQILRHHPNVSVGIHLTLNSEWKSYRWGPVTGREAVPTLVDADGFFFQSGDALWEHGPDVREVEKELRAQIERALTSGVRIDYVDYHMGTAVRFPEFREVTEKLAREYGLGMSGYFGENKDSPQYWAQPRDKLDSLPTMIERLEPGLHAVVSHVGSTTPSSAHCWIGIRIRCPT